MQSSAQQRYRQRMRRAERTNELALYTACIIAAAFLIAIIYAPSDVCPRYAVEHHCASWVGR